MKKTLTNGEIVKIIQANEQIKYKTLPIKASYAISKNLNILNREIKAYEQERLKLIDKYGSKDEEGKLIIENGSFKIDNVQEFNEKFKELAEISNELEIHSLNIDILENEKFSPIELEAIDYMLE